jgi:hypothetical protein
MIADGERDIRVRPMPTTITREEILIAVQAMSKAERLKLIAEIAGLPDTNGEIARISASQNVSEAEVKELTAQFIDNHRTLLRRLAQ